MTVYQGLPARTEKPPAGWLRSRLHTGKNGIQESKENRKVTLVVVCAFFFLSFFFFFLNLGNG